MQDIHAGVVYGGISADFLTDIVVNLAMGNDSVAYILDQRGNVIGHRERSVVEEGPNMIEASKTDPGVADVAAVNQRMIQGETGFGAYKFYGDNKLVGFAPIGGCENWSLAIEASQREFKSTLDRSILLTILVVALVVIASFPVAIRMARSISEPIRACVARLERLSDGDLHTPTPVVKSNDETAELTNALGTTISHLNDVVQDVSHHLGQMARGDFREEINRSYWGDFIAIEQSIRSIHSAPSDPPVCRDSGCQRRPGGGRGPVPEPGGRGAGRRCKGPLLYHRRDRQKRQRDGGCCYRGESFRRSGRSPVRRQRGLCQRSEFGHGTDFDLLPGNRQNH